MMRQLVDARGAPIRLGAEIGRGGEGAVFRVEGAPAVVAKVYHAPASSAKAAKLDAMTRLATPALTEIAAWPTGTLHPRPGGPAVGLLMPRASDHTEVHRLYSPKGRWQEFPD